MKSSLLRRRFRRVWDNSSDDDSDADIAPRLQEPEPEARMNDGVVAEQQSESESALDAEPAAEGPSALV
jgi:hypothetical protein